MSTDFADTTPITRESVEAEGIPIRSPNPGHPIGSLAYDIVHRTAYVRQLTWGEWCFVYMGSDLARVKTMGRLRALIYGMGEDWRGEPPR